MHVSSLKKILSLAVAFTLTVVVSAAENLGNEPSCTDSKITSIVPADCYFAFKQFKAGNQRVTSDISPAVETSNTCTVSLSLSAGGKIDLSEFTVVAAVLNLAQECKGGPGKVQIPNPNGGSGKDKITAFVEISQPNK